MAFRRVQGKTKLMKLPVTTSTAFTAGALVQFSSGLLIPATATSEPYQIPGVIRKTIASTDSDYATARLVEVEVPVEKNVVWEFDVTSGLVAADIGLHCDLTNSLTVNRAASSLDIVNITKVLSTTKGQGILNIGAGAIKGQA